MSKIALAKGACAVLCTSVLTLGSIPAHAETLADFNGDAGVIDAGGGFRK